MIDRCATVDLLMKAVEQKASDLFIVAGAPNSVKVHGTLLAMDAANPCLSADDTTSFVQAIYDIANRNMQDFLTSGDDDFSFQLPGISNFRVNAYRQRGSLALSIRIIPLDIPDYRQIGIVDEVMDAANLLHGLVLVTGPVGSGKTTTLACLIEQINRTRGAKIITIEDPIEYRYSNKECIISQREIGVDSANFETALRSSLRQCPDVLLIGEMRDANTMQAAITAAETGTLVFATMHTMGAANAINRIIDVFPAEKQAQIRLQLAMVTKTIISQQLLPSVDQGRIPAFEILKMNVAAQNLICESKLMQLDNLISSSRSEGMLLMDNSIFDLYVDEQITRETALLYATDAFYMRKKLTPRLLNAN